MVELAESSRRPRRQEVEHRSDPLPQETTPTVRTTQADAPPPSPEFREVSTAEQLREKEYVRDLCSTCM
ncbi:hypothetical protein KSP40_PGU015494 [Platanthera guangdongensis]|uniref:Uncharacterized protein n=1 Tax=Platanthera guangdongensis TaxID=2320717 RepID=A0ABR2M019_9ASPA